MTPTQAGPAFDWSAAAPRRLLIPLKTESVAQGRCWLSYVGGSERWRLFVAAIAEAAGSTWAVLHLFTEDGRHESTEATPYSGAEARATAEQWLKDCLGRQLQRVHRHGIVIEPFSVQVRGAEFGLASVPGGYQLVPGGMQVLQPLDREAVLAHNRRILGPSPAKGNRAGLFGTLVLAAIGLGLLFLGPSGLAWRIVAALALVGSPLALVWSRHAREAEAVRQARILAKRACPICGAITASREPVMEKDVTDLGRWGFTEDWRTVREGATWCQLCGWAQ